MQRLFDVVGAAELLNVSPWTVRAYIRQGRLHPVRFGRLVRLELSELQTFVETAKGISARPINSEGGQQ